MADILDALDSTEESASPATAGGNEQTAGATAPDGTPPSADAGTQNADEPEGSSTGAAQEKSWITHLGKELQGNAALKGFAKLDDLANAYIAAADRAIPGADATPEQKARFLKALGVPDTPDGYTAKPDGAFDAKFLEEAHALHLTDAQVTALTKRGVLAAQTQAQNIMAEQDKDLRKIGREYRDKYGPELADKKLAAYKQGLGKGKIKAILANAGLLGKPEIVSAFIALGEATTEDFSQKGGDSSGAKDYMAGAWFK